MYVISPKVLRAFAVTHPQVSSELKVWTKLAGLADWHNFNELRADMPATDFIGNDRYVFNVKGNHFRLVAMIFFAAQRLYIRGIYAHKDYSKLTKRDILDL